MSRRTRGPSLKPGTRRKHITLVMFRPGGWVVECDCGNEVFLTHQQIHNAMGSCGCGYGRIKPDHSGERRTEDTSLGDIGKELGVTRQRALNLLDGAERSFKKNWELWRLIMDTDLETASPATLWAVVRACRQIGAALDKRQKLDYEARSGNAVA